MPIKIRDKVLYGRQKNESFIEYFNLVVRNALNYLIAKVCCLPLKFLSIKGPAFWTDEHTSEVHWIINPFGSIYSFQHHMRCGWICIYEKMTNLEVTCKWCFIIRLVSDHAWLCTNVYNSNWAGLQHWIGMRFYCFKEEKYIQWSDLTFSCNILRLMATMI